MRMLLRQAVAAAVLCMAQAAHAEVWMVKGEGVLGCRERETLAGLEAGRARDGQVPGGCVILYAGERLLDEPDAAAGFQDTLKVRRGDGAVVFVSSSAVVPDPGIGGIDDRAE